MSGIARGMYEDYVAPMVQGAETLARDHGEWLRDHREMSTPSLRILCLGDIASDYFCGRRTRIDRSLLEIRSKKTPSGYWTSGRLERPSLVRLRDTEQLLGQSVCFDIFIQGEDQDTSERIDSVTLSHIVSPIGKRVNNGLAYRPTVSLSSERSKDLGLMVELFEEVVTPLGEQAIKGITAKIQETPAYQVSR